MKLSDYRNKVWETYPDSFMDSRAVGVHGDLEYEIFENSSRLVMLGRGYTPLEAWKQVCDNTYGNDTTDFSAFADPF